MREAGVGRFLVSLGRSQLTEATTLAHALHSAAHNHLEIALPSTASHSSRLDRSRRVLPRPAFFPASVPDSALPPDACQREREASIAAESSRLALACQVRSARCSLFEFWPSLVRWPRLVPHPGASCRRYVTETGAGAKPLCAGIEWQGRPRRSKASRQPRAQEHYPCQ